MNEKQEKQFETKFSTAVIGFAMQFQTIMEGSTEELADKIVEKYEQNPEMSIDEMTKDIADHCSSELIKVFKLQVKSDED